MTRLAQAKANEKYRNRLDQRGIRRFEVMARETDRELIRVLARKLIGEDAEADRVRGDVKRAVEGETGARGGIWAALRASPLVGSGVKFKRSKARARAIKF